MYKLCKTEQSAARQRQLEQELLTAMLTMSYEDINVSELCQRMGIPRKSFYRYFSGKEGCLQGLIDHTLMEYESFSCMEVLVKRSLLGDLERFFRFWLSQKKLLDALHRSDLCALLVERTIAHAISESVFPGRFVQSEEKSVQNHVMSFVVCGLMTMTIQWHRAGYEESVQSLAQVAARLLTQPLFPDAQDPY